MKKLLAIILAAACAFSLAACAATPDTPNASAPPATEEQLDCIGDPTTQQLAAPVEAAMAQYPNEAKYTASNGNFDSEKYDEDWDAWWESYQEKTADMTDPAALTHWFTTSIPALMQNAGKENRVCSPLNVYMALAMLAAVTDGQTQGQILDALGADSLDELQTRAALLWQENSWNDGLVTSLLANSIWLQDGYEYNEDTLKKLGEEFFASAFSGEMGSEDYNKQLQSWLNDNTGGLLTEQAACSCGPRPCWRWCRRSTTARSGATSSTRARTRRRPSTRPRATRPRRSCTAAGPGQCTTATGSWRRSFRCAAAGRCGF